MSTTTTQPARPTVASLDARLTRLEGTVESLAASTTALSNNLVALTEAVRALVPVQAEVAPSTPTAPGAKPRLKRDQTVTEQGRKSWNNTFLTHLRLSKTVAKEVKTALQGNGDRWVDVVKARKEGQTPAEALANLTA